jgi:hypothetical protein
MAIVHSSKSCRVLLVLSGVAAGYVIGQSQGDSDFARAEVRETAQRSTFLAGSERSETVLREISSTLKTMDRRLERIEKFVGEKKAP